MKSATKFLKTNIPTVILQRPKERKRRLAGFAESPRSTLAVDVQPKTRYAATARKQAIGKRYAEANKGRLQLRLNYNNSALMFRPVCKTLPSKSKLINRK